MSSEFPHHIIFAHSTIAPANVVSFGHFGSWFDVAELIAAVVFDLGFVRRFIAFTSIVVFKENSVENAPTAMAALVHKVTLQREL